MKNYKVKILYSIIVLAVIFSCPKSFAKTIELNGIKVSITTKVEKETKSTGVNVKEEKKFSTGENEKDKKEAEDKYVRVELSIKNENPYEAAVVKIEEIEPKGFRQLDTNKNDRVINIKLDPKIEKKYNYSYRYHRSFLNNQNNSILYDEDGNIIDKNANIEIGSKSKINRNLDNINNKVDYKSSGKDSMEEVSSDLKKGFSQVVIFLLVFVACVIILMVFIMFYKTIKGNDNNFNNGDPFKCLITFLLLSLIFSIVFNNRMVLAKTKYVPQIYEYGKSYEKVIYEPVHFNDELYRFAYKISFTFENTYVVTDSDFENDLDGDGLVDAFEYQYMTDKNNVDTDGDGLNDYLEVMMLDYNPLSDDTYNDGIKDGERDFDKDMLSNIEEVRLGTNLSNADTDYDTLTDYDEVNKYNTNPISIDTDEDLLIDPDELKLGLDPTKARTDGVTLDSERKIEQEYNIINVPEELRQGDIYINGVSGRVSGNIDNEVKISKKNAEVFNSMSSFVSSGFEVSLKENEYIDISLNVEKVSDRKTALTVVKYEDGNIKVINTKCVDNNLNANIGNGIYVVMDSEIVLRDLNIYVRDYMP